MTKYFPLVLALAVGCTTKTEQQSATNGPPEGQCSSDNGGITLPAGFCASVFADTVGHARDIVIAPNGVKLCRPSEAVLEILPGAQRGPFTKEDGEVVIDTEGRRIG